MKQIKLWSIIFLMLAILLPATAIAYDFEVDGIYYNINGTHATVTYGNPYTGDMIIPEVVNYNGTDYIVTSIGDYAFNGNEELTSITIPNSVTSLGEDAFYGCSALTQIDLPNTVTSIGYKAFFNCTELSNITFGNNISTIGFSAFYGTAWLNNQPDGLVYAGPVAYTYKGTMPSNTSIILRGGTLGIASSAFKGCTTLTNIDIPNSVKVIGQSAFDGCTALTSISIPHSVTSIATSR